MAQFERLLNEVGKTLSPSVTCVLTTKNRGAGIPDGGLFITRQAVTEAGDAALATRAPERGVLEVKGPSQDIARVARSAQVMRYLERYGKVLVCTYRDFLVVRLDSSGKAVPGERFTLAADEDSFWALNPRETEDAQGSDFTDYLKRALLGDAPLSNPADLAWFLAAYARTGLKRVEGAGDMQTLATLRSALEDALGLRFEGPDGDHFFRSALVQTLFYGVFASWVYWSEQQPEESADCFSWRMAQWTLSVPMVRVLFQQLATPTNLPVGLDEVLNWTDDVLARVDRKLFFQRFEAAEAVQYFYEPFLQAYDPELRRDLGVWYTPPEIVRYMVYHVDRALRTQLGLSLGLADPDVHVLDPCTGTGSYLTAVLDKIVTTLRDEGGDGLVAAEVKQAALSRIHGFELLPAPFVIAHLRIGIALQRLGVPLNARKKERASVYLTNALTGWVDRVHPTLPFPEFVAERDAAEAVKRSQPILVVLGNPPYNGFAGVSGREEGGLAEPYKEGLAENWDITKNKLDDLYIRFFRVAERRIAEQTGKGIICLVTNSSWLGDSSAVVMRQRLLSEFGDVTIDNLNGDSRETGKKTPGGDPDPSVFSTKLNPSGITRGVAISMLVRADRHTGTPPTVRYRDFWGQDKREQLAVATEDPHSGPEYETLTPDQVNWYRLLRWHPRQGYENSQAVTELCEADPMLGLNENRQFALIDSDRDALAARMRIYLDPDVPLAEVDPRLSRTFSGFDPARVRDRLLGQHPFDVDQIRPFQFRPLDMRYAYIETETQLWNRSRPLLVASAKAESGFLLARRRAPRALDGAALHYSDCLVDQKVLFTDAYALPFWLSAAAGNDDKSGTLLLFDDDADQPGGMWRPNPSGKALAYLRQLGIEDADISKDSATLIWLHALAIGLSPLYFDDVVTAAVHFVEQHQIIRRALTAEYPYLYIDEYQDLAPGLDRLVRALCFDYAVNAELFAVGDPDQAVFGFTGSRPELLIELANRNGVTPVQLDHNYRCGAEIIRIANRMLPGHREVRGQRDGGSVKAVYCPEGFEQQCQAAADVARQAQARGVPLHEIVAICPTNEQCQQLADMFRRRGLPASVRGAEYRFTQATSFVEGCAAWAVHGREVSNYRLATVLSQWRSLLGLRWERQADTALTALLLSYADEGTTPARQLLGDLLDLGMRRALAVPALADDAGEITQMQQAFTRGALAQLSVHDLAERALRTDRVDVTTMTSSKGLEFDVVLILGMEENAVPHFGAKNDLEQLQEERRKFYVSMTRARDEVKIFFSGFTLWPSGDPNFGGPSRFLKEIGLIA